MTERQAAEAGSGKKFGAADYGPFVLQINF